MAKLDKDELNAMRLFRNNPAVDIFSMLRLIARGLKIDESELLNQSVRLFDNLQQKFYDIEAE